MSTTPLISRLAAVSTTSLVDADKSLRILPLTLRPVSPGKRAVGRVVTARANRDLMSVIHGLRECGPGDVLVVDAVGDDRAVAGELFGTEAQRRGLAALVILGRTRDTAALRTLDLPVWSTGFAPHAFAATALPETGLALSLDGVTVDPGDLLVGDDDGLVVGSENEFAGAIEGAEVIEARESALQRDLLAGTSLFDVLNYEEHLDALRDGRSSGLSFG